MAQTTELLKAMKEMLQETKGDVRTNREKLDANQAKIWAEIKTNQEEMEEKIKSGQAEVKFTVSAILRKMKSWRKETMACHERRRPVWRVRSQPQ
jgi:hypothetical protein